MDNQEGRDAKRKRGDSSDTHNDAGEATSMFDSEQSFASVIYDLLQLPDAALSRVFSFISFGERVTFAMSSPAWNCAQKRDDWAKLIIAAAPVHAVDFVDCEIAYDLVDTDLDFILRSICAADNLGELKLTNCLGIIGHGLEPLRGSTALKKIDLSLVDRFENAVNGWDGLISIEAVIPILMSILDSEQCSLKYMQLPVKWRDDPACERLNECIERYNEQVIKCDCCNSTDGEGRIIDVDEYFNSWPYGVEIRTCYECNLHYCWDCDDMGEEDYFMKFCGNCEKSTCQNCCTVEKCHFCSRQICRGCRHFLDIECSNGCHVNHWYCDACYETETRLCGKCNRVGCRCTIMNCEHCWERGMTTQICDECHPVWKCDMCNRGLCEDCGKPEICSKCPLTMCMPCLLKTHGHDCLGCLRRLGTFHMREIERHENSGRTRSERQRHRMEREMHEEESVKVDKKIKAITRKRR